MNIIDMPKIKVEYPAIYALKDVMESVNPPIINDITLPHINALYIVEYDDDDMLIY
jgi:hypothetical protein